MHDLGQRDVFTPRCGLAGRGMQLRQRAGEDALAAPRVRRSALRSGRPPLDAAAVPALGAERPVHVRRRVLLRAPRRDRADARASGRQVCCCRCLVACLPDHQIQSFHIFGCLLLMHGQKRSSDVGMRALRQGWRRGVFTSRMQNSATSTAIAPGTISCAPGSSRAWVWSDSTVAQGCWTSAVGGATSPFSCRTCMA